MRRKEEEYKRAIGQSDRKNRRLKRALHLSVAGGHRRVGAATRSRAGPTALGRGGQKQVIDRYVITMISAIAWPTGGMSSFWGLEASADGPQRLGARAGSFCCRAWTTS